MKSYRSLFPWVLVGAGVLTYSNGLDAPFIFDDQPSIVANRDIRRLWPPGWAETATGSEHAAVNSRPLVAFTLAVNYALGGLDPRGYHLFNLAVHLACALTLFGFIRRTFSLPGAERFRQPEVLALIGAAVWTVHPLGAECINYAVQRSESMASLFYLAMLYSLSRIHDGLRWKVLAVVSCYVGMACKETMVTAPVMAALYARSFLAGSWKETWRAYSSMLLSISSSWCALAFLLWSVPHGGTIGFSTGVSWWTYLLNQSVAVTRYLQLSFWPDTLTLDYGYPRRLSLLQVWPQALFLVTLLTAAAYAARRNLQVAFFGIWVFLVLSPTSTIIPIVNQVAAERRMYLPLAGLCVLLVAGSFAAVQSLSSLKRPFTTIVLAFSALIFLALSLRTRQRNEEFTDDIRLWRDSIEVQSDNPRAHLSLANALSGRGRHGEAFQHYEIALQLRPTDVNTLISFGVARLRVGDVEGAVRYLRLGVEKKPELAAGRFNLAVALEDAGDWAGALRRYREALEIDPSMIEAHNNLGLLLQRSGELDQAIHHFREALRHLPGYAPSAANLKHAIEAVRAHRINALKLAETDRLQKEVETLENRTSDIRPLEQRTLTESQKQAIRERLSGTGAVSVIAIRHISKESQNFSLEIERVFQSAGWTVRPFFPAESLREVSPPKIGLHDSIDSFEPYDLLRAVLEEQELPFQCGWFEFDTNEYQISLDAGVVPANEYQAVIDKIE